MEELQTDDYGELLESNSSVRHKVMKCIKNYGKSNVTSSKM
jgi:hypothetical protein